MTIATETKQFTADDLLHLADQGRYELVDGQLVEKPMAKISNELAWRMAGKLFSYLETNPIARAYNEQGFRCFKREDDSGRIRKPDVAVVLNERVVKDAAEESFFTIRPDIAIEVMSPNDLVEELQGKLADYFAAEVPLVWIIHPSSKTIEVRRGQNSINVLTVGQVLSGELILPGFEMKLSDFFQTA